MVHHMVQSVNGPLTIGLPGPCRRLCLVLPLILGEIAGEKVAIEAVLKEAVAAAEKASVAILGETGKLMGREAGEKSAREIAAKLGRELGAEAGDAAGLSAGGVAAVQVRLKPVLCFFSLPTVVP